MIVIDTKEQLDRFYKEVANKKIIIQPIFKDQEKHPFNNKLSLLIVEILDNGQLYCLIENHSEQINKLDIDYNSIKPETIYVYDKKPLFHYFDIRKLVDLKMMEYLHGVQDEAKNLPIHNFFYRKFSNDANILIPITKHIELYQMRSKKFKEILNKFSNIKSLPFYNSILDSFAQIESNGIKVNRDIFLSKYGKSLKKHLTEDNIAFSEYNFYTATGRPSNRHSKVNYAAMNKKDGTRKSIITRHNNGSLMMFDYSAHHLRIIADQIGYNFPNKDIHTYLGKQYFNKEQLTEEEYNNSKSRSFTYLYGKIPKDIVVRIPFFKEVQKLQTEVWANIIYNGFYESPISGRKIISSDDMNAEKAFNYLIQCLEIEKNSIIIKKINDLLNDYKSKLIMYIYDAFLFDVDFQDGKDLFIEMRKIIEDNGKYPTKVFIGPNYDNMVDVTEKFNE